MFEGVCVVIGIGGMGEAIARRIGPGRHVVLADFNEDLLQRLATAMRAEGFTVTATHLDVSSHESVRSLAEAAAQIGPIRELALTAGLSPTQASAERILGVDLAGVAFTLEEFEKVIAPGGAAVVIASMAGTMAAGQFPPEVEAAFAVLPSDELLRMQFLSDPASIPNPGVAYSFAKRGTQVRVESASLSWGKRQARVNSISPGIHATPMGSQELAGDSGDMMRAMVEGSATGRLGTAHDIAQAAAFLLGPESSFITGIDLLVDGGAVAAMRAGMRASFS